MASVKFIPKLVFTVNLVCLLGFKFSEVIGDSTGAGRGFGNHIKWLTLEEGLNHAKNYNTPIMVLIHKSWCSACKALKPEFAASKDIKDMSKHFVMVNLEDDEEPKNAKFSPDGAYIPRILFLAPGGEVLTEVFNVGGDPSYKYFYSDTSSIVNSMKIVAQKFKTSTKSSEEL